MKLCCRKYEEWRKKVIRLEINEQENKLLRNILRLDV